MSKNGKALTEFYTKEKPKLVGYVRKRLGDSTERDAEDLLQDVMLSFYDREEEEDVSIANITSYIYTAVKNRIIDAYRGRKNRNISFEDMTDSVRGYTLAEILSDKKYDTHNEMEKKEILNRIYQAVDRLKPEQKSVWIATEIEDHTFEELSAKWQEPLGTLLARKHRAVIKLRELLKDLQ